MIGSIPIITFDTSAHNRLVDDGLSAVPIIAGLKAGFAFHFAGLSIEEIFATSNTERRKRLFESCRQLQGGCTKVLHTHNELLRLLIVAHSSDPAAFNWKAVNVIAPQYENAIQRGEFDADDQTSTDQKADFRNRQTEYTQMWTDLRPKIQQVFETHGATLPATFKEALARLQDAEPNLLLEMGKLLYRRASGTDASKSTIEEFMRMCPPFRALIYAMLMSWYDLSVRDRSTGEKFQAGRNDLYMSVYLPYCDKFVTAEVNGEQERCLREVAVVSAIDTEIISYDDFCSSFLLTVPIHTSH